MNINKMNHFEFATNLEEIKELTNDRTAHSFMKMIYNSIHKSKFKNLCASENILDVPTIIYSLERKLKKLENDNASLLSIVKIQKRIIDLYHMNKDEYFKYNRDTTEITQVKKVDVDNYIDSLATELRGL